MDSHVDVEDHAPLLQPASSPIQRRPGQLRGFVMGTVLTLILAATTLSCLGVPPGGAQRSHGPVMSEGTDAATGFPNTWFNGDCGNSAAEARSRGCRFDRILHAWVPPACQRDADLEDEEEFFGMQEWTFYRDGNYTAMPNEEVYRGEAELVYASWHWHLVHCTFAWRKLHRALLDGGKTNSYLYSMHHTEHCGKMLLMNITGGELGVATTVLTKYPTCG